MRRYDPRWLLVVSANLLLGWLTGLANHYLAPLSLHLYISGLFVVFAGLRVDPKQGFIATLLTGLLLDATIPVPFGTHMILLGLIHATLLYGRRRFPREGSIFGIVVAQFANLFLFSTLSFLLVSENPRPGEAWLRIFVDLIVSQLIILLITPWFLALQSRVFEKMHIHPETGRALAR
jgi:rod shape-determining protein MreD